MKTKLLSMILVILIICALAVSCGNAQSGTNETTGVGNETGNAADTIANELTAYDFLPKKTYNGEKFVVVTPETGTRYLPGQIITEEATGDIIMDAAYDRNRIVEEKFDVVIEHIPIASANYYTNLKTNIMAGDSTYDLAAAFLRPLATLAVEPLFLDISKLPYIALEQPWYSQANDAMNILGKQTLLFSDYTCITISCTYGMFYNYDLAEKYSVTGLQETAMAGGWTIDKLLGNIKGVTQDVNGDGVLDENDQFGIGFYGDLTAPTNDIGTVLQYGMGQFTTKTDSDGMPVLDVLTERNATIVSKLNQLVWGGECYDRFKDNIENTMMFAQNQIMFFVCIIMHAPNYMRDMTDDYKVLPLPKFDETQREYYTTISQSSSFLYGFPITVKDPERNSVIFDALSYEGYGNVIPAFFEISMKVKYSRDEISSQMFDLLRFSTYIDFGLVFDGGMGMSTIMSLLLSKKSTDLASEYAKLETRAVTQYQSVIDSMHSAG